MTPRDLPAFTELLDATCRLLSRNSYAPNDLATGMFFRALAEHSLTVVRAAFDAHMADTQRGSFVPAPADILRQIEASTADDGRLGAEEAWALVLTGTDERASVVWTPEIAEAWGVARHVMPDEVGARMAFKEAYGRILREARAQRRPVQWVLAEGFDREGRIAALTDARAKGRHVEGCEDLLALPAPREEVALLLEGPSGTSVASEAPEGARAALQALRDRLAKPEAYIPGPDAQDRERTARLRDEQVERVARYGLAHGIRTTLPGRPTNNPDTTAPLAHKETA